MKRTCLLALAMLVSATAVSAADKDKDDDKTAAADKKAKSDSDPNKMICRSERTTGSLLDVHRICHTRAEWNQIEQDSRRNVDNFVNRQYRTPEAQNPANGAGGVQY